MSSIEEFYENFVDEMFQAEGEINQDEFALLHAVVGLAGEAGEVLDLLKKHCFTGKPLQRQDLVKELGDVEFYLQAVRNVLRLNRKYILDENMRKLADRHGEAYNPNYYNPEA